MTRAVGTEIRQKEAGALIRALNDPQSPLAQLLVASPLRRIDTHVELHLSIGTHPPPVRVLHHVALVAGCIVHGSVENGISVTPPRPDVPGKGDVLMRRLQTARLWSFRSSHPTQVPLAQPTARSEAPGR